MGTLMEQIEGIGMDICFNPFQSFNLRSYPDCSSRMLKDNGKVSPGEASFQYHKALVVACCH